MRTLLLDPFWSYGFMRTALVALLGLALANGPVGVLLLARRMSLTADVLSHAVMPGAAIGFLVAGYSLIALSLGGLAAGLLVGLLASFTISLGRGRSEATLAVFYLLSLAGGVLLVSLRGSNLDLMHVLLGTILAVNMPALVFIAFVASITLVTLAAIWRPLSVESFDPLFLHSVGGGGPLFRNLFVALVVLCLVAGFQAFGTLFAVGPLLLPAVAARSWVADLRAQVALAVIIGLASGIIGLLLSYHLNLPSGPAIVLTAGAICAVSILAPRRQPTASVIWQAAE